MTTPKTPSKPRSRKLPAADATLATDAVATEPAKKPTRKKATKTEALSAAPVEATAVTPPAPSPEIRADAPSDRRTQIRRRALALYRAGSRDTFGNWIQAERETLGR